MKKKIALYLMLCVLINILPHGGASVNAAQPARTFNVDVLSTGQSSSGSGIYAPGDTVTIDAGTPAQGYVFKSWQTSTSPAALLTLADAANSVTSFVMPSANVTASALFDAVVTPPVSPSPSPSASPSPSPKPGTPPSPSPSPTPVPVSFIPVSDITGVQTEAHVRTAVALTSAVAPATATNKTIVWSVVNQGATQSVISGGTLTANATGTVTLRASIAKGKANDVTFTKDFKINIITAPDAQKFTLTVNAGEGGRVIWGNGQYAAGQTVGIFAEALPTHRFEKWVNANGGSAAAGGTAAANSGFTAAADGTAAGELQINTDFVMPANPVTLTATFIAANSSALTGVMKDNKISPAKMKYVAAIPTDIVIDLTTDQNFSLTRVRNGAQVLVRDEDYFMEGNNRCVIAAAYLATLTRGDKVLTFDMNAGTSPQLIVSVVK